MNTDTPRMEAVLTRLEAVERQNRRMKIVGAVVLVLVGAGLLMAQAKPGKRVVEAQKVEAEEFVLKDRGGKVRGLWGVLSHGTTTLMLVDKTGRIRGEWAHDFNGTTRLTFFDEGGKSAGKTRGRWAVLSDGSTSLSLFDTAGKPRAVLGTTELTVTATGTKETTAESSLVLHDKAGKVLFQAP